MLWKSRWSGGWSFRRVVDQPNRARIQGNQILISTYDETLNRTCIYNRLRLVNFPSVPELSRPRVIRGGFRRESEPSTVRHWHSSSPLTQ
jgi:hypothetical protein